MSNIPESECFRVVKRAADGTTFYDMAPLLADPGTYRAVMRTLNHKVEALEPTMILAIESRGYLLGSWMAQKRFLPLLLVRKVASALKAHTMDQLVVTTFDLEYKSGESIALPKGCIPPKARILLVDDVSATGGTVGAAASLVKAIEPTAEVVGAAVVLDLRARLPLTAMLKTPELPFPLLSVFH